MPEVTVTVNGKPTTAEASTIKDIVKDKRAIAALVDGVMLDLTAPVRGGQVIETVLADTPAGTNLLRHSTAHIMAEAVKLLFPDARPTIGPSTEDGFYYDFDRSEPFSSEDLIKIEEKMAELVKGDTPFIRKEMPKDEARTLFKEKGEPYKVEIIDDLGDDVSTVSLYEQGTFTDLCRGPTCLPRVSSRPSSCSRWQGPTGAATRRTRCSSGSTAPPSRPRRNSSST
jgi:threonyl-tRNA synthetase